MEFLLKKGEHYSTPKKIKIYLWWFDFLRKYKLFPWHKEFNWKIKFSKECWYERSAVEFSGANKLRGMTFGIHDEITFGKSKYTKWLVNSALIGWQPNFNDPDKKKINLYLYYDVDGIEYKEIFKSVEVEKEFTIFYVVRKEGVHILFNDEDKYYELPTKTWLRCGYHLYPYFGGKSTSPQDMIVFID